MFPQVHFFAFLFLSNTFIFLSTFYFKRRKSVNFLENFFSFFSRSDLPAPERKRKHLKQMEIEQVAFYFWALSITV